MRGGKEESVGGVPALLLCSEELQPDVLRRLQNHQRQGFLGAERCARNLYALDDVRSVLQLHDFVC